MARSQKRSNRKLTGGRYKRIKKKRLYELARNPTLTKLDKKRVSTLRVKGGHKKQILFSCDIANIYDKKTKKYQVAKIKNILESSANRHFVKRNIMTKGTIIDTELGKAKIVNRPGQEGSINAVLV